MVNSQAMVKPAAFGSLEPRVLVDLRFLRTFLEARDRAFLRLLGRSVHRSHLRDEIVRRLVIEFGDGKLRRISFYQKETAYLGSATNIRDEIENLRLSGLVIITDDPSRKRAKLLRPTQRLVDFYNKEMNSLEADVRLLFLAGNR